VLPLPPFGTLRLEPSAMLALPPLVIPQPGEARSLTFSIPSQPGLVGATLYAQALFVRGTDAHLSNVTIDVIR
jgi:hypothetical protein